MEVLKFSEMRLKKDKVVFHLPIDKIRSNPYQPRKYFNPVGSMLIPRMNIIVPVTSGGKSLRSLNVKDPRIPLSTPENMVMPSTIGMPPICAAITQAANAAESEADIDWNPEPMYLLGNV